MSVDMQAVPDGQELPAPVLVPTVFAHPRLGGPVSAGKLPGNRIVDGETFFRTSQVADSLRDSAKLFARSKSADAAVLAQMIADYEAIRSLIGSFLDETLAEGTGRHCPALAPDASIELVLYAATQLCRWIDAIQATPSYLMTEQVKLANAREVANKVAQTLGEAAPGPAPFSPSKSPGQYL